MGRLFLSTRRNTDAALASVATVATALPVFLVGAVAVQLRESLHFGLGELGIAVSLYYFGAGATSIPLGRVVETVGGLRTMRVAAASSAAVLVVVATAVRSWWALTLLMIAAGVASAAMQPAANLFLARRVPATRQGFAFGLKQAAVPLATMLAGVAVPALVLTLGWRWAFAAAAVWAAVTAVILPRPRRSVAEHRAAAADRVAGPMRRGPLVALAIGFGIGVATASALAAFVVSAAVANGMGRGAAGWVAALGGGAAVVGRILTGRQADRRGRAHLPVVVAMLSVGALGYAVLAVASAWRLSALFVLAVVLVFGVGWGWNGLFNFAVVRAYAQTPARATGVVQAGGRFGGMLGPFAFGQLVAHGSYTLAFVVTAATALCAAAVILLGRWLLVSERARITVGPDAGPPHDTASGP